MMLNTSLGLTVSNQIQETSRSLARSLERLSTGKRINSARDDSAGLSVVTNLSSQIRGLAQANLNINMGRSLIQTADSAIGSQLDIVQRMRELATQAASDTLTTSDRSALTTEIQSLLTEFRRISNETEFNGTKLLDGSFGAQDFQVGANYGQTLNVELGSLSASSVFLKKVGTGVFASATTYASENAPEDVEFADMNGDGHLDLVSITSGAGTASLSVRLNQGDGTFGAAMTTARSDNDAIFKVGDVNGNGIQDVVVLDRGDNEVNVYFGNGDGSFQTSQNHALSGSGPSLALVDLNNNGKLDIVVGRSASTLSILMNKDGETFDSEITVATNTAANDIKAADFDGDGNMDILLTTGASGTSQIMRGDGQGGLTGLSTFATGGTSANNVVGDFDGDGIPDLLVSYGSSTTVAVRLGNGDGTFSSASNLTAAASLFEMEAGDFNNDGKLDFIGRSTTSYGIYFGDGSGGFSLASTGALSALSVGLTTGDVNGDGVLDFGTSTDSGTDFLAVFLGNKETVSAESDFQLASIEDAQLLMGVLDEALESLVEERSSLASSLSRFDSVESYNFLRSESLAEAKSLIEDADIAYETSELVRLQILEQAQISVMSQVNINMQTVLGLLPQL